jgi:hypothetical protein
MVMLEEISYLSSGLAASMIDVQLIWQYRQAYYFRMS